MYTPFERYSASRRTRLRGSLVKPLLKVLILFVVLHLILTSMFLSAFRVDSVSMQPLLEPLDRILVSPLVFGSRVLSSRIRLPALREPRRGEVIVIESPLYGRPSPLVSLFEPLVRIFALQRGTLVRDPLGRRIPRYMVKRVIALPGDTVFLRDYQAFVRPAGAADFVAEDRLSETPYRIVRTSLPEGWRPELPFSGDLAPVTLREGQYFLLGDNRPCSSDSRSWGPAARERIVAAALFRYWPFARSGRL